MRRYREKLCAEAVA